MKTGPYETESERGGSVYTDCPDFRGGSEYRPGNSETVSATGLEGVCGTVPHGAAAAGSGEGQAHLLRDHRAEQQQRGARLRRLSRTRLQSAAEHGDEPSCSTACARKNTPSGCTARIPQPRRKGRANTQWNTLPATAATSRNPTSIPTRTALCCATG